MERKRIDVENSMQQIQEFGIEEHNDHIVLGAFLSTGIEHVEIPDRMNGKPVTVIGEGCFFNCSDIASVSFPDTIREIGAQAFALCKGITELILPDSIISIGPMAFRDCRGLKKVVFPKNLKRIPQSLFSFCYLRDPDIILPEGLEVIEENAFRNAGVFDLLIPEHVKEIRVGAFNCGPRPVTVLPEDRGWFLEWPYGEVVECAGSCGKITDIHNLEAGCCLHEVTTGTDVRDFFFPCDYLDGQIAFADGNSQEAALKEINRTWASQEKLRDAYQLRDAWKRGLVTQRERNGNQKDK